jgi:TolB protein
MLGTQMSRPTWSSDGETIVFASNEDGDFDLYSISVSGGSPQQLTRNTTLDTSPTFRPNTNMVAFVSDQDSPGFTDIYTYDLGTGALMRLTDGEGNLFDPAWSYDGEQLAYISDANGDADLFIVNAQGERPVQLTIDDGSAEDRAPAWSRDGAYIAFASNRDGTNFQWYVINLSNGAVERLNSSDRDAQRILFLP